MNEITYNCTCGKKHTITDAPDTTTIHCPRGLSNQFTMYGNGRISVRTAYGDMIMGYGQITAVMS